MLPDVGGLEWLIIAIVALVVIGPKDLPVMMRKVGQFMARLRNMASEFRASFDEMARQSELDELRKEVEAMRRGQFADMASHDEAMRSTVGDIEQSLADVGVQLHPPMSYQYDGSTEPPPAPVEISDGTPAAKPARKPRAKKAPAAEPAPPQPAPPQPAPIVVTPKKRKPRAAKIVEGGA